MFFILFCSIFCLFGAKYYTRQKIKLLHNINREIYDLEKSIHVLKAEYAYLANPSRIGTIMEKELNLREIRPDDIIHESCEK